MKKTITINISGIVFHIEEDGYETLRNYLDSIKKHFGSFQDSSEILADIESRVAEIFMTKISDSKQSLTAEDVDYLIRTMGRPADFIYEEETQEKNSEQPYTSEKTKGPKKKLHRDSRKKVIGGVCSGLAHYLKIDPVWIRVLFAALVFAGGFIIIAYIIMWAVVPESFELEEQTNIKKIYRDTDRKVISGVAAGIAAYTGTDVTIIRLLFALLIFAGGFGIIAYIILWIAVPEAKSLTEKMQMEGQPVTLSNIEKTIREKLDEKEGKESTLTKIILMPFRVLATILNALGSALGPAFRGIGMIIRIFIGIILTMIGVALCLSIILVAAILLGLLSTSIGTSDWLTLSDGLPLAAFQNTFSFWTILFSGLTFLIPFLFLTLLGISLVVNRAVMNRVTGWSMFAVFLISACVALFTIPSTIMKFSKDGYYKRERIIDTGGHMPLLRMNDTGMENYKVAEIRLHGHKEPGIRIVEKFESQGSSRKEAQENARMTEYNIAQNDSIILFDSNITFKPGASFRAQRVDIDIYFPINKPFVIEQELWELIRNFGGYYHEDRDRNTYLFDEGGLKCLTCEEQNIQEEEAQDQQDEFTSSSGESNWLESGSSYQFKNFKEVNLSGYFDATIEKSNRYSVTIEDEDELKVSQEGDKLIIKTEDETINLFRDSDDRRVRIKITMPDLEQLDASGAGKFSAKGFKSDFIGFMLAGAVKGEANVEAEKLEAKLIGASKFELNGKGKKINLSLTSIKS